MPLLVLLSGSTSSQPDYSLLLMAAYVFLTLLIAIAAIWTAIITRSALKTSSQLSREALEASEQQSSASIAAIYEQIEASKVQSQAAIDAVQRQIEASERQALEALYNQHKPIVIPVTDPSSQPLILQGMNHNQTFTIEIRNKGAGVAMNAFGIVGVEGFPDILCSTSTKILIHGGEQRVTFDFGKKFSYPENVVEGIFVFPQGVFGYVRLMVTYSDIFNNKYFAVYDYSEEFGWRQLQDVRRVEHRLDELVIKRG